MRHGGIAMSLEPIRFGVAGGSDSKNAAGGVHRTFAKEARFHGGLGGIDVDVYEQRPFGAASVGGPGRIPRGQNRPAGPTGLLSADN